MTLLGLDGNPVWVNAQQLCMVSTGTTQRPNPEFTEEDAAMFAEAQKPRMEGSEGLPMPERMPTINVPALVLFFVGMQPQAVADMEGNRKVVEIAFMRTLTLEA